MSNYSLCEAPELTDFELVEQAKRTPTRRRTAAQREALNIMLRATLQAAKVLREADEELHIALS